MGPGDSLMQNLPLRGGVYRLAMGLAPLDPAAWFDIGRNPGRDLAAKRLLLDSHPDDVFRVLPEAESPARELLDLLGIHLPQHHANHFERRGEELFNRATRESWNLARPELHPLDIAGRLLAEDFCLLQSNGAHPILIGATLCAPAHWRLADKIGRPLTAIHGPVPGYASALGRKVDNFFATMKPGRLVCRHNWGIADDPEPFQPIAPELRAVPNAIDAGAQLWLRVERQTLRRLPRTGAIVFTIRTYITRLDAAIGDAATARDLAAAIRGMSPEIRAYKDIERVAPPLLAWLDAFG